MVQDLGYGRQTEINGLNGLVADRSAAAGLDAPANRALAKLIRIRIESLSAPADP